MVLMRYAFCGAGTKGIWSERSLLRLRRCLPRSERPLLQVDSLRDELETRECDDVGDDDARRRNQQTTCWPSRHPLGENRGRCGCHTQAKSAYSTKALPAAKLPLRWQLVRFSRRYGDSTNFYGYLSHSAACSAK